MKKRSLNRQSNKVKEIFNFVVLLLFITLLRSQSRCMDSGFFALQKPKAPENKYSASYVTAAGRLPPPGLHGLFHNSPPIDTGGCVSRPENNLRLSGVYETPKGDWLFTHETCSWKGCTGIFNSPNWTGEQGWPDGPASPSAILCLPGMASRPVCHGAGRSRPYDWLSDPSASLRAVSRKEDWLDCLLDRIWQEESDRRLYPPDGDGGEAVGPLQIHQCVLDDVNEYYETEFTLEDMREIETAKLVARLYITRWMDRHKEEIACRIFNGGPRGWNKNSTDKYWERIRNQKCDE